MISTPKRNETTKNLESLANSEVSSGNRDLYLGTTIKNRYVIEKELGRGGIGVVYLARDKDLLSRTVVIKVLLEASYQKEWLKKKFRQEIEALIRIDHSGIVSVLDAGEMPDGKPFFVMPYVEGVPLRRLLEQGRMNFRRIAEIVGQIGAALNAIHVKGIFHRDLKPENIMIQSLPGGEDHIKLIDFGLAKVKDSMDAGTSEVKIAGSLLYMAPEQLLAQEASASTDIYALGIIVYEMITEKRPFDPKSPFMLLDLQRQGVKPFRSLRPDCPKATETAVLKALSFDPKERYATASEFCDAIVQSLAADEKCPYDENEKASARSSEIGTTAFLSEIQETSHPARDSFKAISTYLVKGVMALLLTLILIVWILFQAKGFMDRFRQSGEKSDADSFFSFVLKNRPKPEHPISDPVHPPVYETAEGSKKMGEAMLSKDSFIGVTFWRLRSATDRDTGERLFDFDPENETEQAWIPERISAKMTLAKGDRIRFAVESGRKGYLYVVNQELYRDATTGHPYLIFPLLSIRKGDNSVQPGRLIEIPDRSTHPNYFYLRSKSKNNLLAGEVLIFLITPDPLEALHVGPKPTEISQEIVQTWQNVWATPVQWYNLAEGEGKAWTTAEKEAGEASRLLTHEDPAPQTIYAVASQEGKPLMVTVELKYADVQSQENSTPPSK